MRCSVIWAKLYAASAEGAAMIRTKGEPGTGDVVQAVRHMRADERRNSPCAESA